MRVYRFVLGRTTMHATEEADVWTALRALAVGQSLTVDCVEVSEADLYAMPSIGDGVRCISCGGMVHRDQVREHMEAEHASVFAIRERRDKGGGEYSDEEIRDKWFAD